MCGRCRTRKGDARSSSAARTETEASFAHGDGAVVTEREPEVGDVVEYPLSDGARAQHRDGRIKGGQSPWVCLRVFLL